MYTMYTYAVCNVKPRPLDQRLSCQNGGMTDVLEQARHLMRSRDRTVLGIVGPPGAGKSTLAERLVAELGDAAVLVPMDGFHLAQAELRRLGRAERKGAPDTFDAHGYAALLRRVRTAGDDEVVYAPAFDRSLEEPIAGAIAIERSARLIVTEGNYLLLDHGPWAAVRPLLDAVWYVDVDDEVRRQRLVRRHTTFGRTDEEALAWVNAVDEPNAAQVAKTRERADLIVG